MSIEYKCSEDYKLKANRICKQDGCNNPVQKPNWNDKKKMWRSYTDCSSCNHSKRKWGFNSVVREHMLIEQDCKCKACGSPISFNGQHSGWKQNDAVVDHCHHTGEIRGLICGVCNYIARHDIDSDRLRSIADYLDNHYK